MGLNLTIFYKETLSEEETKELASTLASFLKPNDVITLEGDLGAGKTTFTKGLALGLGVKRMVTSPTFVIVKEYEGTMPLYHMDVYRLENMEEDIGFKEYFNGEGVSVVEWSKFIEDYLPATRLNIRITFLTENSRQIELDPVGEHFQNVVNQLNEAIPLLRGKRK